MTGKAVDKLRGKRGGLSLRKTGLTQAKFQELIPQSEVLPTRIIFSLLFHF